MPLIPKDDLVEWFGDAPIESIIIKINEALIEARMHREITVEVDTTGIDTVQTRVLERHLRAAGYSTFRTTNCVTIEWE
jgi:hypothetical protein